MMFFVAYNTKTGPVLGPASGYPVVFQSQKKLRDVAVALWQ